MPGGVENNHAKSNRGSEGVAARQTPRPQGPLQGALKADGLAATEIAKRLGVGRASVYRLIRAA